MNRKQTIWWTWTELICPSGGKCEVISDDLAPGLVGLLVGWLVSWLAASLFVCSIVCLAGCLIGW